MAMLRPALAFLFLTFTAYAREPRMSWLDNGTVRLGVNLELGGAITWLSRSGGGENVINSNDWGRQVQMSFYSGPIPFIAGEKRPRPDWAGLGWNPIQAGDCFGHQAHVLEVRNDGTHLYVKCIPMQWPLDNVPGECTMESWLALEGPCVLARGRLVNAREDYTQYHARSQELPAVYANGPFHRIFTYSGAAPFTGAPLTQVEAKPPPQWTHWLGTEGWSALVDDHGFGLGVWSPGCVAWIGGFNGQPGAGGPADSACGYLAPTRPEVLDHNLTYDFEYRLVLGTTEEIRAQAVKWRPAAPEWHFTKDRQGWTWRHAEDAGWPLAGELKVSWSGEDPQVLSPQFFAPVKAVTLEAAFTAAQTTAELYWSTLSQPGFSAERLVRFPITGDGQYRPHRVELPPGQSVLQLRLDPADGGKGEVRLRAVRVE